MMIIITVIWILVRLYIVVKKALKKGEIGYAENFSSSRYAE